LVNNFIIRTFSSLFLLTLFVSLYYFQPTHFIFLIFFIFVYSELLNNKIINLTWTIALFLVCCLFLYFYEFVYNLIISCKLFILLIYIITVVAPFTTKNFFYSKILLNLFIFTSFILFSLLYIYNLNLFLIVILLTSINDIIAYISGNFFKGPKIIPLISPNKTWSGTIFSYLISVFFIFYFLNFNYIYNFVLPFCFFIGDIYFSYFKRIFDIKDYGKLIRGHGGFLDRFDSSFLSLSFSFMFFLFI
jgi:phosphatidate cytidylyltransferase